MAAIIYARFSPRPDSAISESNDTQIELCQSYCITQGMAVGGIFQDSALSGDEINRPALWNAIEALKKGDSLVVYRLDRLARSVYLTCIIEQEVKKKKAKIISVCGEGNGDSHEDKLVRGLTAVIYEYQKNVNAARTKAAMLRHQKTGRRMSRPDRPPFGWMLSETDSKRIVKHEGEQAVIEYIVQLRAGGASLGSIAKQLPPARIKWTRTAISNILKRAKI